MLFIQSDAREILSIQLISTTGQEVHPAVSGAFGTFILHTIDIPDGVYLLKILTEDYFHTEEIIVQH
jgi:hypothetical protein